MFRRRNSELPTGIAMGPIAAFFKLGSTYYDSALKQNVTYNVRGARYALPLMFVAGTVSGLLGIGSGVLKVPAMDIAMKLPMKVSTATSNFMIGVTAAASAGVYMSRGYVDPGLAAPVMLGVAAGAFVGARVLVGAGAKRLRVVFAIVVAVLGVEMVRDGLLRGRA
jgi:hypothetical protein